MPTRRSIVRFASSSFSTPAISAGRDRASEIFGWIIAALLPLIGILPTLGHGVINAADGPYHVHRIQAMEILLRAGQFWPRWVPYFHLGFGYPVFNFYPPGVSYFGGILAVIGLDAATAFNIVAALAWIIGSVGVYALARELLPAPGAILAALLWSYAPSRLHEVWYQGGLAQMMSAAFMPWFFRGLIQAATRPSRRAILALALPLAAIILTHIPITYITALFGAPLALILPLLYRTNQTSSPTPLAMHGEEEARSFPFAIPDRRAVLRRYATIAAGVLLGIGLGAIFFVPMALELQYIRGLNDTDETISFLTERFLMLDEVFAPVHAPDYTDLSPAAPITLGLVGGLFALVGLIALLRRRRFGLAVLLSAALGFTIFMLLESSLDVWLAIPYFQQLRFPERLLRAGSIWLALLGGSSLLLLPERWQLRALWIVLPGALIASLPGVYGTDAFITMDHLTALDEINFELDTRVWGTTSYDEYDPIWGERIPLPSGVPEPEQYITDPLRIVVYRNDVNNFYPYLKVEELDTATIKVTLTEDHAIRFHQYYYPGWHATLDGESIPVRAESKLGLLTVDVPAGEHLITLDYAGTNAQRAGAILSGISVLIAVGLLIYRERKERREIQSGIEIQSKFAAPQAQIETGSTTSHRAYLALMTAILLVTLINAAVITPHTMWFRQKSPPDDPAAMQTPVRAVFGDSLELLGYTLHDDHAVPGQRFDLTLYWRAVEPITTSYKAIVQIVNPDVTEAWASSEQPFPNGAVGWTPDHFASDVRVLKVFDSAPLAEGRLMIQLIDTAAGQPELLPDGSSILLLPDPVRVEKRSLLDNFH